MDMREEMRRDMLQEAIEEQFYDKHMREDFDYFIDNTNASDIIIEIEKLYRIADEYGYDRGDITNYIKDNI